MNDAGMVRAEELIRLCLLERFAEAEALMSTVPDADLYDLASAFLTHAAHAYRQNVGVIPTLALLAIMKEQSDD